VEVDAYEYTPQAWRLVSTLKGSNDGALGAAFALASAAPTGKKEGAGGQLLVSEPPEPTCNVPFVGAAKEVATRFMSCGSALKKLQGQAKALLDANGDGEQTPETPGAAPAETAETAAPLPPAVEGTKPEGEAAAEGGAAGVESASAADPAPSPDAEASGEAPKEEEEPKLSPEAAARLRAVVSSDPTSELADLAVQVVADDAPPELSAAVGAAKEAVASCEGSVTAVVDLATELRSPPSIDASLALGFAACAGIKLQFDLGEAVPPGTSQSRSAYCQELEDDVSLGEAAMVGVAECRSRVAAEQVTLAAQKEGKRLDGWKLFAKLQGPPPGEDRGFGIAMGKDEGAKRGDVYIGVDRSEAGRTRRLGWGRIIRQGPGGAEGAENPSHFKFRVGRAELGTRMEEWAQIGVLLGAHPGMGIFYLKGDLDTTVAVGGGISGGYNASQFVGVGDEFWSRVDIGLYRGSGDDLFVTIDLLPEAQFYVFSHASVVAISGIATTIVMTTAVNPDDMISYDLTGTGVALALGGAFDWAVNPNFNFRATTRLHQGLHKVKLKGEDEDSGNEYELDGGALSQLQFLLTGVYTF